MFFEHLLMERTNRSNKPPHQGTAARWNFHVMPFLAMNFFVSDKIN